MFIFRPLSAYESVPLCTIPVVGFSRYLFVIGVVVALVVVVIDVADPEIAYKRIH